MKSFGCIAYEAYYESSLGKSLVSGAELPAWQDLPIGIRNAWERAADAVHREWSNIKPTADPAEAT